MVVKTMMIILFIANISMKILILFHVVSIPNVASFSITTGLSHFATRSSTHFLVPASRRSCTANTHPMNFSHTSSTTRILHKSQTSKRVLTLIYLSSSRIKAVKDRDEEQRVHQNRPYRSKRRQPPDSRTATRWVIESIEKVLEEEDQYSSSISSASSAGSAVNARNNNSNKEDRSLLLNILYQIPKVRSKEEAQKLEHELMNMGVEDKFSFAVQERVLKVASMAGFVQASLKMLDFMLGLSTPKTSQGEEGENLDVHVHIPSYMAYISVLNRLRKWNRVDLMRDLLEKLSNACRIKGQKLHIVALNTYLAALCDEHQITSSKGRERRALACDEFMDEAISLLEKGVATERYCLAHPDVMSFNTVLNAVAISRNETLMEHVMHLMQDQGIEPDTVTYNAMLKAAPTADAKISILDKILNAPELVPDRYTIEMVLVPLVQMGRIDTVMSMLQRLCSFDQPQYSLQNAFSTFLLALVKDGEIDAARAIFDRFLLSPSLEQSDSTSTFGFARLATEERHGSQIDFSPVKPITRHFNALLEGYRMLNDPYKSARLITTSSISPREHACNLFDHMKAMNVSPDCFTLTLFMSMQNNREEITETWNDIMEVSDFRLEPPAFHSLITAYGKVGDASSACYVLNKMIEVGRLSRTSNSWCVLLSALSKASSLSCRDIINCNSCSGTGLKIDMANLNDKPFHGKDLVDIVNGCTYPQAAKIILDLMTSSPSRGYDEIVPRPNSQAYCLVASSLSHTDGVGPDFAISMFNNATANGRRVDGRYLNAIIRCYGENITAAVDAWKNVFRPTVLNTFTEDIDRSSSNFPKSRVYKNLVASYHGLIYVAGRAYRPDVALRLVYAMTKEGVEPTEAALNTYNSGARERREDAEKVKLHGQYENLLAIECTKYDSKDERRQTDQRIRIIL